MASIYEGAHVVLTASDAKYGHDGFLMSQSLSTPPKTIFRGTIDDGDGYSIRILWQNR